MNKKNILIVFGIIGFAALMIFLNTNKNAAPGDGILLHSVSSTTAIGTPNTSSSTFNGNEVQAGWKTYENTKYKYKLKYPNAISIQQTQEEERESIASSSQVDLFISGKKGIIRITAWQIYKNIITNSGAIEHNRIVRLNLADFAEAIRSIEIADKNPNFPKKQVSPLQKISLAGETAYSYVVTDSMDGFGYSDDTYVFVEHNGVKIEFLYSHLDKTISTVFGTLELTKQQP